MKTKTTGNKSRKPVAVNIHNPPKFPLGLPGERNGMAKTKTAAKNKPSSKKSKGGRRNTAAKKAASKNQQPSQQAMITRAVNAALQNRKKSGRKKKRNSSQSVFRNGFTFKGLDAADLGIGGLSLIVTQALAEAARPWVDPRSWMGIGIRLGMAAGIYAIAPSGLRAAATTGAGILPAADAINKLTGNVIGSTITSTVRGFLPTPAPAPSAGNGAAGMAGFRRMPGYMPYVSAY